MIEANHELIQTLSSAPDWWDRRQAALRLAMRPGEGSYEALVGSLSDRDPDVRQAAIRALGALGDTRAVDLLCRPWVLEDPSAEIRWAAVIALGELGSLANASSLSKALDDPEWVVRNQALLVMSDLIRAIPEAVDGEQVKSLIRLLAIPDAEVRSLVVDALARRSTRGLDEMVEALRGQSRMVRAGVAEALGLSRDPRAVAPLIEATSDPVGLVRREAARGLGRLGDATAVEALIVALGDSDTATCKAAVGALVAIGGAAVVPLCMALAHATSKVHRRNIILALGGLSDPRAIIPLLNNLSSTYYVVRRAAIAALSGMGEQVVDELITMVEVSSVPVDALAEEIATQPNKRLRLRAIRAVGELKNASMLKPLKRLMSGHDPDVVATTQEALSKIALAAWARHGAVIALGNIGSPRAAPALIQALRDYSEYVRGEAAKALARLPEIDAAEHLAAVLEHDEHPWVRREAAAALRSTGSQSPRVAEVFRAALGDSSWEVRAEAARALGRIDDPSSIECLLAALDDDLYSVMISAVHALANLERYALPALFEMAAGVDGRRRDAALRVMEEAAQDELRVQVARLRDCPEPERAEMLEAIRAAWR